MYSQRLSSLIGTILSLLGGALVFYSVFFLPMVFGSGGGTGMVISRHIAAITTLIIQGPLGFVGGFLYAFGAYFGAGYWLALLGCAIVSVGHLAQFALSKVLERGMLRK